MVLTSAWLARHRETSPKAKPITRNRPPGRRAANAALPCAPPTASNTTSVLPARLSACARSGDPAASVRPAPATRATPRPVAPRTTPMTSAPKAARNATAASPTPPAVQRTKRRHPGPRHAALDSATCAVRWITSAPAAASGPTLPGAIIRQRRVGQHRAGQAAMAHEGRDALAARPDHARTDGIDHARDLQAGDEGQGLRVRGSAAQHQAVGEGQPQAPTRNRTDRAPAPGTAGGAGSAGTCSVIASTRMAGPDPRAGAYEAHRALRPAVAMASCPCARSGRRAGGWPLDPAAAGGQATGVVAKGVPMLPSPALAEDLIATAHALADAARPVTLQHFRAGAAVANKAAQGFDPVTAADREAEAAMRAVLARRRPHDAIFGEEGGAQPGTTGLTWVLDPIDGTRAYISGSPTWGVLISVEDAGGPLFGVVDQPFIGERFSGGLGRARYDGPCGSGSLGVRHTTDLAAATLFTTFPEVGTPAEGAAFARVRDRVRLVRYGLDCYAYALLAAGQIDLVIEAGLARYDISAHCAVIAAAGGVVTDWAGGPAHPGGRALAAATPALHAAALPLLAGVDAALRSGAP